jgi:hypothetical protein
MRRNDFRPLAGKRLALVRGVYQRRVAFRLAEQFTDDRVVAQLDPFDREFVARGVEAPLGDRRDPRSLERPASNRVAVIHSRYNERAAGPVGGALAAECLGEPAVEDGVATVFDLLQERQEWLVAVALGGQILEQVTRQNRIDSLAVEGNGEFIYLKRVRTGYVHGNSFVKKLVYLSVMPWQETIGRLEDSLTNGTSASVGHAALTMGSNSRGAFPVEDAHPTNTPQVFLDCPQEGPQFLNGGYTLGSYLWKRCR